MANILLIEPDRLIAETYHQALQSSGYRVIPCASAQAAIMAADQIKPDLVIMEIQLVEHSGIEFLYEFRSYVDWQSIPVIINSFVPESEFKSNHKLLSSQLGVVDYLYKPSTNLASLVKNVSRALSVIA